MDLEDYKLEDPLGGREVLLFPRNSRENIILIIKNSCLKSFMQLCLMITNKNDEYTVGGLER